jgi:hypothetical protein
LREAIRKVNNGEYGDAVIEARKAIDAMDGQAPDWESERPDRGDQEGRANREPAAGLNSIPVLCCAFVLVISCLALKISFKRSNKPRDKKGKVSRMKAMSVSFGGRSATSLAAAFSTFVGAITLSGGSG